MTIDGWAVVQNGKLQIETVNDTAANAAAIWISINGGRIIPGTPDEAIVDAVESHPSNPVLVKVTVTLKKDG